MATRYTPQQGIPYITPDTSPCDLAEAIQAIETAADAKGAGYDLDVGRTNGGVTSFVRVSVGAVPANGNPAFTNVDINLGTPTDLVQFNGLLLNPGLWLCGGYVSYSPGTATTELLVALGTGGGSVQETIRDAGSTLPTLADVGWPHQGATPVDLVYANFDRFPISLTWTTFSATAAAQLWAIQLGTL